MTTITDERRDRVTSGIEIWLINDLAFLLAAKDVLFLSAGRDAPPQLATVLGRMIFGPERSRLSPDNRHVAEGLAEFFDAEEFQAADWGYLARRVTAVDIDHLWTPPEPGRATR